MTPRRSGRLSPKELAARATAAAPAASTGDEHASGGTSGEAPKRKCGRPRLPGRSYDERSTRTSFICDPVLVAALNELVAETGMTKRAWLEGHIRADTAHHRAQDRSS